MIETRSRMMINAMLRQKIDKQVLFLNMKTSERISFSFLDHWRIINLL